MVLMTVCRMKCRKARHADSPAQFRASLGVIQHQASWSSSTLSFLPGELATLTQMQVFCVPSVLPAVPAQQLCVKSSGSVPVVQSLGGCLSWCASREKALPENAPLLQKWTAPKQEEPEFANDPPSLEEAYKSVTDTDPWAKAEGLLQDGLSMQQVSRPDQKSLQLCRRQRTLTWLVSMPPWPLQHITHWHVDCAR